MRRRQPAWKGAALLAGTVAGLLLLAADATSDVSVAGKLVGAAILVVGYGVLLALVVWEEDR